MYLKQTAHLEIADTLRKSLPLQIGSLFAKPNITSELIPLLLRIITPDLKPINQQLIKTEERLAMKKLIRKKLDLNIKYIQDRNEDNQIVYRLEPALDVFIHYDGKKVNDMPVTRFNLRQLIAKEMEAEALRRLGGNGAVDEESAAKSTGKGANDILNAYKRKAEEEPKKDGVCRTNS